MSLGISSGLPWERFNSNLGETEDIGWSPVGKSMSRIRTISNTFLTATKPN